MVAFTVFRRDHSSRFFYAPPLHCYTIAFLLTMTLFFTIRITELRLPLEHPADALPAAIAQRLGVTLDEVLAFTMSALVHAGLWRGYCWHKWDSAH